jgi:hypothetical protein
VALQENNQKVEKKNSHQNRRKKILRVARQTNMQMGQRQNLKSMRAPG